MNQPERGAGEAPARAPRVAILVLGCLLPVYDRCVRTIRATWGSRRREGIDVFYAYGGQRMPADAGLVSIEALIGRPRPDLADLEAWACGDIILCGAADLDAVQGDCILRKRLAAFGYLANGLRYDFVYTVCASSYVDVDVLRRYVDGLPATGVYHGPLAVHSPSGAPFVSGASMLLSRDLAGDLADAAEAIIQGNTDALPDDVAIGRWIAANRCAESAAKIRSDIVAGTRTRADRAFALPFGKGMVDFVLAPPRSEAPQENAYHYHFHSRRMREMEAFHRRFFAATQH